MIFSNTNTLDNYKFITQLREIHPYINSYINKYKNLNNDYKHLNNDYNNINNIELHSKLEKKMLYTFIKKNKNKILWWPKFIWKMDLNFKDYMNTLNKLTKINIDFIPNDGWIISSLTNNSIYKLKPYNKLTIDLLLKNNQLYCKEKIYQYWDNSDNKIQNNIIYRCYFNDAI